MTTTMQRAAEITVALPADEAMQLFTPEGERAWAPGWNPSYPAPERDLESGFVFATAHHDRRTVWIVVDRSARQLRYARLTPGWTAGTVAVDLLGGDAECTRVRVTYDLTALTPDAAAALREHGARFAAELAEWEIQIARSISDQRQ